MNIRKKLLKLYYFQLKSIKQQSAHKYNKIKVIKIFITELGSNNVDAQEQ
jgi:hypothetical protein